MQLTVLDFHAIMHVLGMNNFNWPYYSVKYNKINCYAIDKFFAEVVYDAQHNVITEVRSFKYGHSLDRYATKIE